jgi:hypothetical protein
MFHCIAIKLVGFKIQDVYFHEQIYIINTIAKNIQFYNGNFPHKSTNLYVRNSRFKNGGIKKHLFCGNKLNTETKLNKLN